MRKILVIVVSILSVFILCSLSYQPIIADTPIENIPIIKKSKVSNLDADEIKELYNRLIEMKSQSNDDCGCNKDNTDNDFPIICDILENLEENIVYFIYFFIMIGMVLLGSMLIMYGLMIVGLEKLFNC